MISLCYQWTLEFLILFFISLSKLFAYWISPSGAVLTTRTRYFFIFLEASYFLSRANWSMRYQNRFGPIVCLSFSERMISSIRRIGGVGRKRLLAPSSSLIDPLRSPFFSEAYRRRTHFQRRGFFSGFLGADLARLPYTYLAPRERDPRRIRD